MLRWSQQHLETCSILGVTGTAALIRYLTSELGPDDVKNRSLELRNACAMLGLLLMHRRAACDEVLEDCLRMNIYLRVQIIVSLLARMMA